MLLGPQKLCSGTQVPAEVSSHHRDMVLAPPSHLNHLLGIGVIEHKFSEGCTAGWKENHQHGVSHQQHSKSCHREVLAVTPQKKLILLLSWLWEREMLLTLLFM